MSIISNPIGKKLFGTACIFILQPWNSNQNHPVALHQRQNLFLKKSLTSSKIMISINTKQCMKLFFFKMKLVRILTNRCYLFSNPPTGKSFFVLFCTYPQIIGINLSSCFFRKDKTC